MTKYTFPSAGFSTTPGYKGPEHSWQRPNESEKPLVINQRVKALEQKVMQSASGPSATSYPPSGIQKATVSNTKFWKPPPNQPPGNPSDAQKGHFYGFPLPKYTPAYVASQAYISGDKFDPKQTLFRYDPEHLNTLAERDFRRQNPNKPFIPPHNVKSPVYEGFPDRRGAQEMGRAWNNQVNNGKGNEVRPYLFDIRQYKQQFKKDIEENLSGEMSVAVRTYFAMSVEPTKISRVSTHPWFGSPEQERMIKVSRTVGSGEQIIGNPDYFKFKKP